MEHIIRASRFYLSYPHAFFFNLVFVQTSIPLKGEDLLPLYVLRYDLVFRTSSRHIFLIHSSPYSSLAHSLSVCVCDIVEIFVDFYTQHTHTHAHTFAQIYAQTNILEHVVHKSVGRSISFPEGTFT